LDIHTVAHVSRSGSIVAVVSNGCEVCLSV